MVLGRPTVDSPTPPTYMDATTTLHHAHEEALPETVSKRTHHARNVGHNTSTRLPASTMGLDSF